MRIPFETTGTWTPTPEGSTTAGSPTGTFEGRYIKTGTKCYVVGRIVLTGLSTMAGNLRIVNLPFTVASATLNRGGIIVGFRTGWTNDFPLGGFFAQSNTRIDMYDMSVDNTPVTIADMSATSQIYFAGEYEIA